MILFKKQFIDAILNGTKTETRRKGKKRWNVGAIHQCQLSWFDKNPFGKVEILSVHQEKVGELNFESAKAEGFNLYSEFKQAWIDMYGEWNPDEVVWVVKFKLVENLRDKERE